MYIINIPKWLFEIELLFKIICQSVLKIQSENPDDFANVCHIFNKNLDIIYFSFLFGNFNLLVIPL